MCVGQALLPLRVDESKYSFRSYFRPVGPCKPLRDTSPKSKIQPRVKPMEAAGFDRIITDSHNDWILSHTQTVPSSYCDCDWLISDRVLECIPLSKYHLKVFPSQQDMKCSICMLRGGGVVHKPIFPGYVPLASHNPSPILQN